MAQHAPSYTEETIDEATVAKRQADVAKILDAGKPESQPTQHAQHGHDNPPAASAPAEKERKSNRAPGTKGVLLQLSTEQYAQLEAAAQSEDREVSDFVWVCIKKRFEAFIGK